MVRLVNSFSNLARFFSLHPLTCDGQFTAWARFVSWQIRSRIYDEVIISWIDGQRLAVRRGMAAATGNIYVGLFEFSEMLMLLHFLREGDLFLDIGSNIGSFTILASGVSRATTWAFEPDPETVVALKRNTALNELDSRVVIHELALGDINGTVSFTRGLDAVNRVATNGETAVRTVPVVRLDTLVRENRPVMIKMDVEGYEEQVVRGAEELLAGDSLKVIEIETVTTEIEATFNRYDFRRAYYDPFRRALSTKPNGYPAWNALFVRDWNFVAARLIAAPAIEVLGKSI
jgi:FkbM family methyltransferase